MGSDGPRSDGCAPPRPLHSAQAVDVASASNFRAFQMLHLHLDLRAEFGPPGPGPGSRGLSGTAVLELRCLVPEGATELRLDSHPCLEVTAAALRRQRPGSKEPPAEPVLFHTQPFSHYGQALCVALPQPCPAGERFQVLLTYRVGEGPGVSSTPGPCPAAASLGSFLPALPPRCWSPDPHSGPPSKREKMLPPLPGGVPELSGLRPLTLRALSPSGAAQISVFWLRASLRAVHLRLFRPSCLPNGSASFSHTALSGCRFCLQRKSYPVRLSGSPTLYKSNLTCHRALGPRSLIMSYFVFPF